ncbi:MAG TPA: hypothetical protein VFJ29_00730 [Candidatus Kapabacteria bacterium]|nr:hypothetical protein [Candidatus Kapabacteria bacterium]
MKNFIIALCLLCAGSALFAMDADSSQNKAVSSVSSNQDNMTLPEARTYDHYLNRVVSAINSLDPTMRAELPEWVVNDRELKRRIIATLRKLPQFRSQIDELSDVVITQNPRTQELLRLVVSTVELNSREEIESVLGTSTYDKLRDGNYDKVMKVNPVFEPKSYQLDFSLYRADIVLKKSGFAFEWINGKEQIGYPFWLNGTMTLGGAFIRDNVTMHLGIDLVPASYGNTDANILGPFDLKPRKLEGAGGATGSLEIKNFGLDPSDGLLGITGFFTYGFGLDGGKVGFSQNPDQAYNVSLIGLAYLTYAAPADGDFSGFSFGIGGGGHRIDNVAWSPTTQVTKILSRVTLGDVYGRVAYDHQGEDHWGLAVQYSNMLMTSAYYEFFTGVGLELKYALRMNNRNDPWEYDSYFVISPRISISL